MAAIVVTQLETVREQRELFLWKFPDVPRADVTELMKEFELRDIKKRGEIEELDILIILERRGNTHTATELRELVADMDKDKNKLISFLELCCAVFNKDYELFNNFTDEGSRKEALEKAMEASAAVREAEAEIEKAKRLSLAAAETRAAELERESKLTGVAGAAAFFSRQIEGVSDKTMTNMEKIKQEAARRKAVREARLKEKEAFDNANKTKSPEEIAREVKEATERAAAEEAARLKASEEQEKAIRAARKAELNAKWAGSSVPKPK